MKKILLTVACLTAVSLLCAVGWTTKRLTNNSGASAYPAVAASGANIYAVWSDDTPGNNEIYFRKSIDEGATWQAAKRLSYSPSYNENPAIAVSGSNVYVVWKDTPEEDNQEIYFRRSLDSGATWQNAKRLTNNAGSSLWPRIALDGADVYVVWYDDTPGNCDIYFLRSADHGATWQAAKKLTNNAGNSTKPFLLVNGSNLQVVWSDDTPGNYEIYRRQSTDGGATWQTAKRMTNNTGNSRNPMLAASGASIYLVWEDDTPGNTEVYFRRSTDNGATWQSPKRLTNNTGTSCYIRIAASGADVFVVWQDDTPGNMDVHYLNSTDSGTTWGSAYNMTNNAAYSATPFVALNDTKLFVFYSDNTPGNAEIYLKYLPN